MSAPREVAQFDFRRGSGLPANVEQRMLEWARALCAIAPENWGKYLHAIPQVEYRSQRLDSLLAARMEFPETSVGYCCELSDNGPRTLFVLSRPLTLALVHDVLGERLEALPEDRELTAVEQSFCDLLLEELCQAVGEAWPEQQPLTCRLAARGPKPRRTRLFPPTEQVLLLRFAVSGPFGQQDMWWLLPRAATEQFVAVRAPVERVRGAPSQTLLEQRTLELPAQLVVHLGESQLDVAALAELRVGDVVILNQRITEPLTASVAGCPKFLGWPGRVGVRQAFQVEKLIETSRRGG